MIEFLKNFLYNVWESILDLLRFLLKAALFLLFLYILSLFNCSGDGDLEVHRAGFGDM